MAPPPTPSSSDTSALTGRAAYFSDTNVVATSGSTVIALHSGGQDVHFQVLENGTTVVGYTGTFNANDSSNWVFKASLSDDDSGSYKFTLMQPIDHPVGGSEDDVVLTFNYTARDGDGDTVSGKFSVDIDDDTPVVAASQSTIIVDEEGLAGGNIGDSYAPPNNHDEATSSPTAKGVLSYSFGADGASATTDIAFSTANLAALNLTSHGLALAYSWDQASHTLTGSTSAGTVFTLTVANVATGDFFFTQSLPLDHPVAGSEDNITIPFNFTVTDRDGDTAGGSVSVVVNDDAPVIVPQAPVSIVDGDFHGIQGVDFTTPGSWSHPLGAVDSKGSIDGWTYTASTTGGAATVQLERVDSGYAGAVSSNGNPMVDLEATPGNIQISQAVNGLTPGEQLLVSFEIGEANFGNARLAVLWDDTVVGIFDPQSGHMQLESIVVTALGNNSDVLTFREIGVPGDNTGTFLTNVTAQQIAGSVDEGGLNVPSSVSSDFLTVYPKIVGNDQGTATIASGSLASLVHFGADGPAMNGIANNGFQLVPQNSADATAFVTGLHLTSLGSAIDQATLSGNTLTATAHDGHNVFTLAVNGDGSWTFTLLAPLDDGHLGEDSTTIDFSSLVQAVDFDGDTIPLAAGSFNVAIVDDVPVATAAADSVNVNEHGLTGTPSVQAATGFLNIHWGADDGAAKHLAFAPDSSGHYGPALTSGGVALDYLVTTVTGGQPELVAYKHGGDPNDPVFTITLYAPTGEGAPYYTFALFHPLDESGAGADTVALSFNVTATDSDGDSIPQGFTVNVTDDVPHPAIASTATTLVIDETAGIDSGTNDIGTAHVPAMFSGARHADRNRAKLRSGCRLPAAASARTDRAQAAPVFSLSVSSRRRVVRPDRDRWTR